MPLAVTVLVLAKLVDRLLRQQLAPADIERTGPGLLLRIVSALAQIAGSAALWLAAEWSISLGAGPVLDAARTCSRQTALGLSGIVATTAVFGVPRLAQLLRQRHRRRAAPEALARLQAAEDEHGPPRDAALEWYSDGAEPGGGGGGTPRSKSLAPERRAADRKLSPKRSGLRHEDPLAPRRALGQPRPRDGTGTPGPALARPRAEVVEVAQQQRRELFGFRRKVRSTAGLLLSGLLNESRSDEEDEAGKGGRSRGESIVAKTEEMTQVRRGHGLHSNSRRG